MSKHKVKTKQVYLNSVQLWLIAGFILISFLVLMSLIGIIYFITIPELTVIMSNDMSDENIYVVVKSIKDIIFKLGFWVSVAFGINIFQYYVLSKLNARAKILVKNN